MLSTYQKAILATIAGSALLIALVLALRAPALGAASFGPLGGGTTLAVSGGNGAIAPGVITTGDATVKVRPDIAILSVGATAQAATAAEAQAQVAERIERILAAAQALGISDEDTKTSSYNIQPRYAFDEGRPPEITGYEAQQMVTLTLRDIDRAGETLDALVQNDGATNASIVFSLDDPKPTQAEARRLAIEEARSKAEAMAGAAGVRLGDLLSLHDRSSGGVPLLQAEFGRGFAPAADTQIPVGDLEVVVQVQVQYAIE